MFQRIRTWINKQRVKQCAYMTEDGRQCAWYLEGGEKETFCPFHLRIQRIDGHNDFPPVYYENLAKHQWEDNQDD